MDKPISIEDYPACCACGAREQLESHHVVRRSQGGTTGATMWFCVKHHRNITENIWAVSLEDRGYRILETATGEILSEVHYPPEGFDAGKFVENLGTFSRENLAQGVSFLETAQAGIQCLPEEALRQMYEDAYGFLTVGVLVQAWAVDSYLGRFVRGEMAGAVATASQHFGCDPRTIYNRLAVAKLPLKRVAILPRLPARALTEAGKAVDIEAAMDIVESRLAQGVGSVAIEGELRAIRKQGSYEEPFLERCPCCGKQGDPKTFKWKGEKDGLSAAPLDA